MTNPRSASDRIYLAVKAALLAGAYTPGERIEAAMLAERHMTSLTPIRAALHRLVGEQLVEAQAGEGFHAPLVTESGLRDLYAWNGQIIQLACQLSSSAGAPGIKASPLAKPISTSDDDPMTAAALFAAVGERSGNEQCASGIAHLNDQLHLARRLEGELFSELDVEFFRLADTIHEGQRAKIRQAITAYHRRRIGLAAELVRLMHRRH